MDECDALLRKHEAFERLLISQEEKVMTMIGFADRLCAHGRFEAREIRAVQEEVLGRRTRVKAEAVARRSKLEDCRKLMLLLQNIDEVGHWCEHRTHCVGLVHVDAHVVCTMYHIVCHRCTYGVYNVSYCVP